jgi:uncharacterized protein
VSQKHTDQPETEILKRSELLTFPCDFPVKVLGRSGDEFRRHATQIVERHMGAVDPARITERVSRDGNFLALTFNLKPHSREQLDDLYRELSASESIVMVL